MQGDQLELRALVGHPNGSKVLRTIETGHRNESVEIGKRAAQTLLDAGAAELIAGIQ